MDDPDMFSLDGFDEGDLILDDPDGVAIATGGGVAFPQSDDEEISTDGALCTPRCIYMSCDCVCVCVQLSLCFSLFTVDSSFRDVSDLTAGGVAMSVPLSIPMYPPQRTHESSQQVSLSSCYASMLFRLKFQSSAAAYVCVHTQ